MDLFVEGSQGRGPAPQVPMQILGRLFIRRRRFRPGAAVIHESPHEADLARLARTEKPHAGNAVGRNAPMGADLDDASVLARGLHHRLAFDNRVGDGLLHVNVRPGLDGVDGHQRMPMIRRRHNDNLRLFPIQQLPVIHIEVGANAGLLLHDAPGGFGPPLVHIAKARDLALLGGDGLIEDVRPPPAAADQSCFVAAVNVLSQQRRGAGGDAGRGGSAQETTARHLRHRLFPHFLFGFTALITIPCLLADTVKPQCRGAEEASQSFHWDGA